MKNIDKTKKPDATRTKRTWLKDVDYKNGGLISDNKKKMNVAKKEKDTAATAEKTSAEPAPKKKKSNFLSSKHKEEHDNIFSKKFKANKFEDRRKKKK